MDSMRIAPPKYLRAHKFIPLLLGVVMLLPACGVSRLVDTAKPAQPGTRPTELAGSQRIPPPQVGENALPDVSKGGEPVAFQAEPGGLLLVYFGYTNCPDVCPTTLADVRSALRDIGEDKAARVDLAMVTIDPDRDTDEVMVGYVRSFVSNAKPLRTTDQAALATAAADFGVQFEVITGEDGEIEVVHTGSLFAVDDQGQLVLTWPFGTPVDDLTNDLWLLLEPNA